MADVLLLGGEGPNVGNWQRFLVSQGITGKSGPLAIDERYGPETTYATSVFQANSNLPATGKGDPDTVAVAKGQNYIPFIQASQYTRLYPHIQRYVGLIVIHTMECAEVPGAAVNVAHWFSQHPDNGKGNGPRASAHYCVDESNVVQCVREVDVAWHANQVNDWSIGIEHAGYASQTPEQWASSTNKLMLLRSARLAAAIANRYGIPPQRLTPGEVSGKAPGFCGHVDVTVAYSNPKGHTDPGPSFPWTDYLELVRSMM